MSNKAVSLSDLDATKASADAFEFEYVTPDGTLSGMFFSVFGGQSESVTRKSRELVNESRRKEAARQARQTLRTGPKAAEFNPIEDDVEFGQKVAAARLAGWRGEGQTDGLNADQKARFCAIKEPFTPENALRLCQINRDIAAQATLHSEEIGNFMKL